MADTGGLQWFQLKPPLKISIDPPLQWQTLEEVLGLHKAFMATLRLEPKKWSITAILKANLARNKK